MSVRRRIQAVLGLTLVALTDGGRRLGAGSER